MRNIRDRLTIRVDKMLRVRVMDAKAAGGMSEGFDNYTMLMKMKVNERLK